MVCRPLSVKLSKVNWGHGLKPRPPLEETRREPGIILASVNWIGGSLRTTFTVRAWQSNYSYWTSVIKTYKKITKEQSFKLTFARCAVIYLSHAHLWRKTNSSGVKGNMTDNLQEGAPAPRPLNSPSLSPSRNFCLSVPKTQLFRK